MRLELLFPVALALCVVAAIKIVESARIRRRLIDSQATPETIRELLEDDRAERRLAALRWALVLLSVGLSFGMIGWMGLDAEDPETFGLLAGGAGVGLLVYHLVARRALDR